MSEYVDFNVSREVAEAILSATSINNELLEPEVSTLDILIASLTFPDTRIFEFLEENNNDEYLNAETLLVAIMGLKDKFEKIFGYGSYYNFINMKKEVSQPTNIQLRDINGKVTNATTFRLDYSVYLKYTQELEEALIMADKIDKDMGRQSIRLDTLIYCMLTNKESKANILLNCFFKTQGLMKYLKDGLGKETDKVIYKRLDNLPKEMKQFVTNLNSKFSNKSDCDILGRDEEIFQVWNIISKKTKRNAVLIGEPGVGKTAIVEAITCSIVNKTCPKEFEDYTVYSLNLNNMVAGTKLRGEFEEKTQKFIEYLEKADKTIIFLDEIHTLLGTGSARGSGPDLSNSLKPILSRDNVIFIGATTTDEYNKFFSIDGALSRRFEVVTVKEPKHSEVIPMIQGRVKTLSDYHGVKISKEMLNKVLICASSFSDISNPDRTIDLIDKSMAVAKLNGDKVLRLKHIKRVYIKYFEAYSKINPENKRSTAYHEAGHFVTWYLSKTKFNQECVLVSIIPAKSWLGVNIFEPDETKKNPADISFIKEKIAGLLGGRIAQKFVNDEIDSGASSDLRKANSIAEKFIMEYGIDEEYSNYSFNTSDKLGISDKTSDNIREKTKKLVNEVYKSTEELLLTNRKAVENVAELLMRKGIITKEEAIAAIDITRKSNKKRVENEVEEAN